MLLSAVISLSSAQSPLITIASTGSPNRSEIRVSSSPKTSKSTLREIRISRPDSPSISINRAGSNQPITFTSNTNGGTITNGSGGAFHISLGGRSSPVSSTKPETSRTTLSLLVHSSDRPSLRLECGGQSLQASHRFHKSEQSDVVRSIAGDRKPTADDGLDSVDHAQWTRREKRTVRSRSPDETPDEKYELIERTQFLR